ncbi:hypothetical protein EBU24_01030 [bacterium]|nr:hypothetical protein [bacterium]
MATATDELVALIGVEVDKQKLAEANKSLKEVATNLIGIKTAVLAASLGIFEFERRLTRSLATVGQNSKLLNTSAQELQVLQYAAEKSGVSFDSITGSIAKLNTELADLTTGAAPQELLITLGKLDTLSKGKIKINIEENGKARQGIDVWNDLAAAFEKLKKTNPQEALSLSQKAFGSNILPVLDQISKAKKELTSNNLLLSDRDIENARILNEQFILLGKNIEIAFKRVSVALEPLFDKLIKKLNDSLPAIQKLAEQFTEWLTDPKTLKGFQDFISNIAIIAKGLAAIGTAISFLTPKLEPDTNQSDEETGKAWVKQLEANRARQIAVANNVSNSTVNNQSSSSSANVTNNTTNQNKTSNTTINNTIVPSNHSSIYLAGSVR